MLLLEIVFVFDVIKNGEIMSHSIFITLNWNCIQICFLYLHFLCLEFPTDSLSSSFQLQSCTNQFIRACAHSCRLIVCFHVDSHATHTSEYPVDDVAAS